MLRYVTTIDPCLLDTHPHTSINPRDILPPRTSHTIYNSSQIFTLVWLSCCLDTHTLPQTVANDCASLDARSLAFLY